MGGRPVWLQVKQPDGRFVLFDDNEAIPFDAAKIPDYCFGGPGPHRSSLLARAEDEMAEMARVQ